MREAVIRLLDMKIDQKKLATLKSSNNQISADNIFFDDQTENDD